MICRLCEGKGGWYQDFGEGTVIRDECPPCLGTGRIGLRHWLNWAFWDHAPVWFVEWYGEKFYPDKEDR